jgi:hypothetical protein
MIRHSDSLLLVWKVSDFEARNLSASLIEPQHLFLGLLKSVDINLRVISELLEIDTQKLAEVARDLADVRTTFEKCQIDTTRVRRKLRQIETEHSHKEISKKKLRRSSESREIFRIAEALVGDGRVKPIHLLSIISETRIPSVLNVFNYYQKSVSALRNESTFIALAEINRPNKNQHANFFEIVNLLIACAWTIEWSRSVVQGNIRWCFKITKNGISHIVNADYIEDAMIELSKHVVANI